ncbi:MAG: TrbI/VirB10 family protein [Caulobacterales bacterium]|jgi:type IV secretion system protein VirB10
MASYDYRDPRSPASVDEPPPQVAIAERGWVVPVMVLAALGLGALVFLQLSQGRERQEQARLTDPAPGAAAAISTADLPPPAPIVAPPPIAPPVAEPAIAPPQLPAPASIDPAREAEFAARLKAPSLVVDLSEAAPPPGAAPAAGAALNPQAIMRAAAPTGASDRRGESDERFAADIRGEGAIKAERLAHPAAIVIEGTMMAAVLETAINSDLPGLARAVVSRDVRSFDGTQILIPRGSRVIGQYKSGVALGQSRAFVIWTRLIRPDGVSLPLAAPATDEMGRGGLQSRVDRHFLRRFGGAILLSLISAGANAATDPSDTQIIIAGARGGADAASVALQKEIDLPPTLSVPQGQPIRIFVSRDLDFSSIDALP